MEEDGRGEEAKGVMDVGRRILTALRKGNSQRLTVPMKCQTKYFNDREDST